MNNEIILWLIFGVIVTIILGLDLGVLNRKAHAIKLKEAATWSSILVAIALIFGLLVYFMLGKDLAVSYVTAYVVELSLSIDNLFVFMVVFAFFSVPETSKHRVLFWGIIGAMVFRAIFIVAGLAVVQNLHWIVFIFGIFLIYTGIKLSTGKEREVHPEKNVFVRLTKKIMPVSSNYVNNQFFTRENGRRIITPLLLVLIVIETTDIMFAVDSIPAVLSISLDPLVVYASNILAILGLRAFYFLLAGFTKRLRFLSYGLAAILAFLGIKMILSGLGEYVELSKYIGFSDIPILLSLGIIFGILAVTILTSLFLPQKNGANKEPKNK
ncbi:MAG: TerC family protein [Dehalococcoidales bacterium]|nr:TerC family protein [Dehalococcoidales bacterium]